MNKIELSRTESIYCVAQRKQTGLKSNLKLEVVKLFLDTYQTAVNDHLQSGT